jgi:hypothetical protein
MTFPAFRYATPMDYVSADAIDRWLYHRGFDTWSRRRDVKRAAADGGFSFKYGDTTYSIVETIVDGVTQYAVWFDQITRSTR